MDGIDGIWKRAEKWVVSLMNDLREVADAFCPILLFPWFCPFWLCSDICFQLSQQVVCLQLEGLHFCEVHLSDVQ